MDNLIPNTFGLTVRARRYAEFVSVAELKDILAKRDPQEPLLVVGGGSNMLFTRDFDGLVLHSRIKGMTICGGAKYNGKVLVQMGSGVKWDDFCAEMARQNIFGTECLSYIPGEVGASAVQNVGAYGVEASEFISLVEAVDIATGEEVSFTNEECKFGYRDSIFKHEAAGRYVITYVTFSYDRDGYPRKRYKQLKEYFSGPRWNPTAMEVREKVIEIRRSKLPETSELGSAGSFFTNPVVDEETSRRLTADNPDIVGYPVDGGVKLSAARLIDLCGLKGYRVGNAGVYDRQPLVIVNYGGATAAEVMQVAEHVQNTVKARFGVELRPEVIYI